MAVTEREEILGRLQVDLGGARQLPLIRLRGQVRPVILCGSRAYVEASIREADPLYQQLRARGVSGEPMSCALREDHLIHTLGRCHQAVPVCTETAFLRVSVLSEVFPCGQVSR